MASRRSGLGLIAAGVVLAIVAFVLTQSYVSGEASKVTAPRRPVAAAAADIPAGALVDASRVVELSMPVPDDLASLYLAPAAAKGVAVRAFRKGEPLRAGDLLPADAAVSIAPLVPLKIKVGPNDADAIGAINIPLGRLVAAPPKVQPHDRIDLWAGSTQPNTPSLQLVLDNVEILAFNGAADAVDGWDVAVSIEQLDRYLFFSNGGAPLIVSVRSSQAVK